MFGRCFLKAVLAAVSALAAAPALPGALPEYSVAPPQEFPAVSPGSAVRLSVASETLADDMTVDVWLPPTYDAALPGGYPVVYVHDGQNLFDPSLSFSTVAWELDQTAASLASKGEIAAPIIVGIHNRGAKNLRPNDYFPEKALSYISAADRDRTFVRETCSAGFFGDEHAEFVACELKPLVDDMFNTAPDRGHTFAMGSSMGALASMYLLCEYPDIFGGAACMSTHWIGSFKMNADYSLLPDAVCAAAVLAYMDGNLPDPAQRRLYLDQGTTGWDADYLQYETLARAITERHGYSADNGSLMTFDASGAGHNEWFWQQRAARPLTFLLKNLAGVADAVTDEDGEADAPLYDLLGRPVAGRLAPGLYISGLRKILITE